MQQASPDPLPQKWPAPAKLNLFLHITGQRADGYHLLQTVFQFIDFCDQLSFELRDDGLVTQAEILPGISEAEDLTVRAGKLLQQITGTQAGASIQIEKNIPLGGGLGGGSSDAATTLVALNVLWQLGLSIDQLAQAGLQLGADVPVFVRGQAAWAEGVGEVITPITLPQSWFLVIIPPCHVPTAEIFSATELTRDASPIKIHDFLAGQGINACEPVVRDKYPDVDKVMVWLSQYAKPMLTGTGACVFAAFDTEQSARDIAQQLPEDWHAIVARGLNESPLQS